MLLQVDICGYLFGSLMYKNGAVKVGVVTVVWPTEPELRGGVRVGGIQVVHCSGARRLYFNGGSGLLLRPRSK